MQKELAGTTWFLYFSTYKSTKSPAVCGVSNSKLQDEKVIYYCFCISRLNGRITG